VTQKSFFVTTYYKSYIYLPPLPSQIHKCRSHNKVMAVYDMQVVKSLIAVYKLPTH